MNITGIDRLVYGVDELERCARFLADFGLEPVPGGDYPSFATLDGGEVSLLPADAPGLPPPLEPGPTLRRIVWGVGSPPGLDRIRRRLEDLDTYADGSDGPSCADPNGMSLAFRISRRRAVAAPGSPLNTYGSAPRIDARSPVYERARPIRIGHVVFFAADLRATLAFYRDRLGFVESDSYPDAGYFLRGQAEAAHHDLFLLQGPQGRRGLNHVAYVVRDIHEVFGGGINMARRGWETQIGPGRHPVSSAYFWYLHNPGGGLAEYYTNEDYCTAAWQPREWQRSNENFAEWAVAGGIDARTRRQT